jgi:hypothetical protein
MILSRKQIVNITRQALEEIGMEPGTDAEMEALTVSKVLEQLHDAGGTNWDPSPNVLAGLIVMLFLEKKNYPRKFNGKWLTSKDDDETTVGDMIDYLNEQQTDLE